MARYAGFLMGVCLFLAGCEGTGRKQIAHATPSNVIQCSHVDPNTGDLIALWMVRTEGWPKGEVVPVLVPHAYAVYIHWPSPEGCPDPLDRRIFLVYDNVTKKAHRTGDYDAFLELVANLPKDITLLQIDTCTTSRCHMPEEQWERLEKVLADGNRTWAVNPVTGNRTSTFCYCEFVGGFIYPGDKH